VLHLINSLGGGGAERSLVDMLPLLRDHGVHSDIAVFEHPLAGVEAAAEAAGVRVHTVAGTGVVARVAGVRSLIRRLRPDVVHTTLFDADVVGRLAAVGTDSMVLTSLVNMSYATNRLNDPNVTAWKLDAARRVDGFTARHLCDGFHAITQAVATSATQALSISAADITVIPRGRDSERLGRRTPERRAAARAKFQVSESETLVVNVGRQEFQKDQETLLRAIATLKNEIPNIRLVVAGREGNATATLRHVVGELGLEKAVTFLGFTDDVPELLVAADIFVFPSRFEGLGGSVLEAMALEVPIVASDIPPLREVLAAGERGALAAVGSPAELSRAIQQVLGDEEEASRRVARGRAAFENEFDLISVASAMAAWMSCLRADPRGPRACGS
jgi:glycosyltransferase involved in cell wall biosynthesis